MGGYPYTMDRGPSVSEKHQHDSYAAVAGRIAQLLAYAQDTAHQFTPKEAATAIGWHRRTMLRYLHGLAASGFIERVGLDQERQEHQSHWRAGPRLSKRPDRITQLESLLLRAPELATEDREGLQYTHAEMVTLCDEAREQGRRGEG